MFSILLPKYPVSIYTWEIVTQAAAQKIIDKIHSTTTTADEIRATAKALQEENARAEEARQAQAKASAIKAQEQARQSQAQAKQAEAQKYSDIRAKNQNLGAVSNPTPVVNSEIPKIAESKPVETAISKPSKNIWSVNIDKYTSSPIEKSANKMAEHASKYVDGEMEKGNRPMDMGILSSLAHMMKQNNAGQKYRLGDVLKSPYLRDLYKDALDAPISIMDSSMKRWNTIGSYWKKSWPMKWEILLYGGDTEGINKLPDIILHEAAHAMRDVKGRSMSVDYHEVLPSQKPLPKISKPQLNHIRLCSITGQHSATPRAIGRF